MAAESTIAERSGTRWWSGRSLLGFVARLFAETPSVGYYVDNRDCAPARLPTDLPIDDVYEVLRGLDRYREAALDSLSRVGSDYSAGGDVVNVGEAHVGRPVNELGK